MHHTHTHTHSERARARKRERERARARERERCTRTHRKRDRDRDRDRDREQAEEHTIASVHDDWFLVVWQLSFRLRVDPCQRLRETSTGNQHSAANVPAGQYQQGRSHSYTGPCTTARYSRQVSKKMRRGSGTKSASFGVKRSTQASS